MVHYTLLYEYSPWQQPTYSCRLLLFAMPPCAGAGADVNKVDQAGNTALHLAFQAMKRLRKEGGEVDLAFEVLTVDLLLRAGANPDAQNCKGQAPIHIAAQVRPVLCPAVHCLSPCPACRPVGHPRSSPAASWIYVHAPTRLSRLCPWQSSFQFYGFQGQPCCTVNPEISDVGWAVPP